MAEITGKQGNITFSGLTASVISWSLDTALDIHDKTDFTDGAAGYRTKLAGLPVWSATVETNYDTTNTVTVGLSALLSLTLTSGKSYAGTAMLASISVNTPVDGLETGTYTFEGNGALSVPA